MHDPALSEKMTNALGGLFGVALLLLVLLVIVSWIIFPILMYGRIGEVIRALNIQNEFLKEIARNTKPPSGDPANSPSSVPNYMMEPRSSAGVVIAVLVGLGILIFVIIAAVSQGTH